MNFFRHQDEARSRTTRLLILFGLALAGITLGVYIAFLIAAGTTPSGSDGVGFRLWRPDLLFASALCVGGIVGLASFVKTKSLGDGGSAVAESVGGRRVAPNTTDPLERRLYNVVEEMSVASGVPVPAVYVLPDETGINAFAAGFTVGDAAVAVTRGTLHLLTRSELQAVIGHEFSHILNGDMRLNIRLIGILFGLMMIGTTGGWMVRIGSTGRRRGFGRQRDDGIPFIIVFGVVLWLVGSIGVFAGRLIQRAISRQREFLADASAVQFTRNPAGLVGALKKIGGFSDGALVRAKEASELSHLFFGDALGRGFGSMFATHPPLDERIRRLDPSFDGRFPAVEMPDSLMEPTEPLATGVAAFGPASSGVSMELPGVTRRLEVDPASVVDRVGTPTPEHLAMGAAIVDAIPDSLLTAARSGLGAVAVVYAVLLDHDDAEHAARQRQILQSTTHPRIYAEMERLAPTIPSLPEQARLPLVELAVAGLRQLSPDQYAAFRSEVAALAAADGQLSLFEFAVQRSLLHWLDAAFGRNGPRPVQYYAIRALTEPLSVLLSALAHVGHDSFGDAATAFRLGASRFRLLGPDDLRLLPPGLCSFDRLDAAVEKLSAATPALKAQFVDACAHCVLADRTVGVGEAELLRVVATAFGCPLPPFLPAPSVGAPEDPADTTGQASQ